jgi:hypothetical protein
MRKLKRIVVVIACAMALVLPAAAQPPGAKPADGPSKDKAKDFSKSSIVTRMMAFDKNKDGQLTRDEVTDERLLRLFDMADTNKDGVVTKEELMALAAKLEAAIGDERGGPGGFGPGGPGGRGGPGGPGGPGGFGPGGPPQPGQVLPPFLQEQLKLTAEQKKQLADLQKEVDDKLGKILTDDQKKQLKEMRGGFGPGGRGPGGPPPGGPAGARCLPTRSGRNSPRE